MAVLYTCGMAPLDNTVIGQNLLKITGESSPERELRKVGKEPDAPC